jgi:pimeloyl-ACP methyl ester carboxylesterase
VTPPPIRYTRSGDVNIAYQVTGDGPFDLVLVPGFFSHLEVDWEHAGHARFLDRLGSFARLIRFDKRGTGLSDRAVGLPDFETRMDDLRAVMDAADSQRAALLGYSEGGPMSVLFAASYPRRTRALVLYGATRSDSGARITPGLRPGRSVPRSRRSWRRTGARTSTSLR